MALGYEITKLTYTHFKVGSNHLGDNFLELKKRAVIPSRDFSFLLFFIISLNLSHLAFYYQPSLLNSIIYTSPSPEQLIGKKICALGYG